MVIRMARPMDEPLPLRCGNVEGMDMRQPRAQPGAALERNNVKISFAVGCRDIGGNNAAERVGQWHVVHLSDRRKAFGDQPLHVEDTPPARKGKP